LCCKLRSGGFEETPAPYAAGGHLIASILSGSNDPENLVPVSTEFNAQMKVVENQIAHILKGGTPKALSRGLGEEVGQATLKVKVTAYDPDDGRIPRRVEYTLNYEKIRPAGTKKARSGTSSRPGKEVELVEYESVPDSKTWTIDQAKLVVRVGKTHQNIWNFLQALKIQMPAGWAVEKVKGYETFAKSVPGDGVPRPYAVLDYWLIVKKGEGYVSKHETDYPGLAAGYQPQISGGMLARANFEAWQMDLMRRVCYAKNDGYLKSDAHGRMVADDTGIPVEEKHEFLIHGAAGNGDSFDHILPAARGGSNLFSNCQITSSKFNSSKGGKY
jgi:hypothetical protein